MRSTCAVFYHEGTCLAHLSRPSLTPQRTSHPTLRSLQFHTSPFSFFSDTGTVLCCTLLVLFPAFLFAFTRSLFLSPCSLVSSLPVFSRLSILVSSFFSYMFSTPLVCHSNFDMWVEKVDERRIRQNREKVDRD